MLKRVSSKPKTLFYQVKCINFSKINFIIFVDKTWTQDRDLDTDSLGIDSRFTNIPVDKTIGICMNKVFQSPETLDNGISKNDFLDLMKKIFLLPKNHCLHLTTSFTFRYTVLLWNPLQVQHWLAFSYHTVTKTFLINIL